MTTYTAQQLADFPWVVSCDTLRPEDLLVKFWNAAETCAVLSSRPELLNPETLASLSKLVGEDSKEEDWDDEEANATLEDLSLALDDASPDGFYFGALDGDGALFGYWLTDSWNDALQTLGLGDDDPAGWAPLIAELEADGIDPDTVEDSYCGRANGHSEENAGANYAQELAEELGVKLDQMAWPLTCVDWHNAWCELVIGDGYRLHDIGGEWLVFRAV